MSEKTESSARVAVWAAVITAVTTVLTTFIGIVPRLRQSDQDKINQLTQQNAQFTKQATQGPSGDAYSISGFVRTKSNNAPLPDAFLLAGPASDQTTLDDDGKFVFPQMRNQYYNVVVRTQDGKTRQVLITPSPDSETDTDDLAITYSYAKE